MKLYLNMFLIFFVMVSWGCSSDKDNTDGGDDYFTGDVQPIDPSCTSVRLTEYDAGTSGWCEFSTTHDILPDFVKEGMHFAIAEPWAGSSFGGEFGEACGECWQVDTIYATQILMVTNLCPIEGNPLCSGGNFHFDLSGAAADKLGHSGLTEASVKRVPCPVTGNIYVQVNNSNEWGYMRLAFINHAIPVRSFEVKVEGGDWIKGSRSGGAYEIKDGPTPSEGAGMIFRVKSAEGEIVTSTNTVPFLPDNGTIHDLGVQFTPEYKSDQSCEFLPPADVYNDSWGGIDKVVWRPNPWKDHIKINEKTSGCYEKSSSCLEVLNMAKWEGAHFYYGQPFPFDTFGKLSVAVKSVSGKGTITITPNGPDGECTETEITVDDTWQEITIDLAAVCTNVDLLNTVTVKNYSDDFDFILDKIQFK